MNPIQAIVGTIAKTIQDALSGAAAQSAQASQMMNLKAGASLDDDDESGGPAQASNTLIDREMARIQAMLAQASGGQQGSTSSNGSGR